MEDSFLAVASKIGKIIYAPILLDNGLETLVGANLEIALFPTMKIRLTDSSGMYAPKKARE